MGRQKADAVAAKEELDRGFRQWLDTLKMPVIHRPHGWHVLVRFRVNPLGYGRVLAVRADYDPRSNFTAFPVGIAQLGADDTSVFDDQALGSGAVAEFSSVFFRPLYEKAVEHIAPRC